MASPDLQASIRQHQAGNLDAAIAGYRAFLEQQPQHAEANRLLGLALFARGQVAAAREALERAASLVEPNAALLNDLGNARRAMGDKAAAVEAFSAAIKTEPGFAFAHFNLADTLLEAGDIQRASDAYEDIVRRGFAGIDGDFHVNRGLCRLQLGDAAAAMEAFRAALALEPGHSRAAAALSDTMQKLGAHRDAVIFLTGFLDKQRASLETLISLGTGFLGLRDFPRALGLFERLATSKPSRGKALTGMGLALSGLNRHEEAIQAFDAAIVLDPHDVEALISKGVALKASRRLPEAIEAYGRVIEIAPRVINAHFNLGNALVSLREHGAARDSYKRAWALDQSGSEALSAFIRANQTVWHWDDLGVLVEKLHTLIGEARSPANPFNLLGICDDPELHQIAARAYTRETLPSPPAVQPPPAEERQRLRIGYFSADFRNHAVMQLLVGALECHDRDAFEIHAFSYGPEAEDAMRARIRATMDHFHECARLSDGALTAMARRARIDIAIDLNGYTQDARLAPFAQRLAPLQVSYLGYPGTVGADFLDYIVADTTVLPMDQQRFYDEKIVHLPDSYQANDDRRLIAPETPPRAEAGLPADGFVYCCFNNAYKITPEVFAVWMRILNAVPGSVLWLLSSDADAIDRLRTVAAGQEIDPARLIFGASLPSAQHLARHRLADLFLDTLPYNAHTTASDALWAGLPVLTQMGQAFAGRVAASLLNAVGMPELITRDAAEYEALAIALGRDPARAGGLRTRLATAIPTAPLFNTPRFTRHLESAYRMMWQRHAAGLAPEGFAVPAED
ncbi:MAG: tetratricopeptide repeat protein [Acetobacteraceae bacterium]